MHLSPTIKTTILFGALTALLVVFGYLISGTSGAITFLVISAALNILSYWFSDKIALGMVGARQVNVNEAPELYADIKTLAKSMGIPTPRLYISPSEQPNAFATGRNPANSVVCLNQGLLRMLNRDEVKAVVAHELGHIKNRDVLVSTIAAVMAGAVSSLAQIGMFFGSGREERNPFAELLLIIFAPIAAIIIQLAISRSREYQADAISARYTGRPMDLVNALTKIDNGVKNIPVNTNPALSSLFIANPFSGGNWMQLFSTHPSLESRIKRLMNQE